MITNNWTKAILSLVVIGFLVLYPVHSARSVGAIMYVLKEFGLDLIARVIGRTFLTKMINSTTDFLSKNGRDGLPNFVQDWRSFLQEAQYRGEDITRATIGEAINNNAICDYLKSPLANAFGAFAQSGFSATKHRVDSLQYYALRNRCTLPVGFNVNTFRNDFSVGGGWAAWDKLIQPQNNFFGVYADSLDELEKQRSFEERRDRSEAEAGSGFTSKTGGKEGGCEIRSPGNVACLVLGQIQTPSKILGEIGSDLNTGEFDWLTSCDELSECLISATTFVLNRLGNFTGAGSRVSEPPPADTSFGDAAKDEVFNDCVKSKEAGCVEKAKRLECTTFTSPDGTTTEDCVEIIDQGIFNVCMDEARRICTVQ
ncbi:MAG: hypothetical protein HYX20_03920 [Candidatus Yanofskybacteria bacterium]|nr:hypothetical protein [Candidatus Yanofskybacteria bacterium]